MAERSAEHARGLEALEIAATALEQAGLEHWFFGGWAVDLWVGRPTRAHDDIDVLVWRRDEPQVHQALTAAGWLHTPSPDDLVGTNYAHGQHDLQLTFVVPGEGAGVVVPVPDQPIVLSVGSLPFVRRNLGNATARVLTLETMLAIKGSPGSPVSLLRS